MSLFPIPRAVSLSSLLGSSSLLTQVIKKKKKKIRE
ncbi:hypothetical protein LINPERHAP1_LOCUS24084 [Linum perenne]